MKPKLLIITMILICFDAFFFTVEAKKITITSPIDIIGYRDQTDIEEVEISESAGFTEIPDYFFLGCTKLRTVHLPNTLKIIGFQAFSECRSLEHINLPEGLEEICSNSFAYCTSLKNLTLPSTLLHIGHNAFSFCESITEVSLPDSIIELESYAFSDCVSLKTARLPANGNLLGELIFNCCPNLKCIVMPSLIMPEIDCGSFLFDPIDDAMLTACCLYVPSSLISTYQSNPSYNVIHQILPIK